VSEWQWAEIIIYMIDHNSRPTPDIQAEGWSSKKGDSG
jgi:hypothetical protein